MFYIPNKTKKRKVGETNLNKNIYKVKRVAKIFISKKHPDYNYFKNQMEISTNIYNYINFLIRQKFFLNTKDTYILKEEILTEYPSLTVDLKTYFSGSKLIDITLLTRVARNYVKESNLEINTKVITSVVRKLFSDWSSFFALLKAKKEGSYTKDVSIPKYKKNKYNLVEYTNQTISKKLYLGKGLLGTTQMEGIKIPDFIDFVDISSFRVYYKYTSIIIEIIYDKEISDNILVSSKRVCSADIGLDVLLALTFNFDKRPLNVNGKPVKSINQYFNKELAKAQSQLPKNIYTSNKIQNLYRKREVQIRNYFGYVTNKLVDLLVENNIDTFVIGYNKEQKQEINLGKKTNQNFVSIPFYKLREIIKYKLEEAGIKYVEQEESYTSKTSFLDNDYIPTYKDDDTNNYQFSGKRIKRGLYKTINGKLIHADTNGSFNIMRKAGFEIENLPNLLNREIITPLQLV